MSTAEREELKALRGELRRANDIPDPSQEAGWAEAAFGEESDEEGDAPDDRDPDSSPETDG